ncbi:hypothetical protein THAOC_24813 [Thalassiosira oceanica]|uniref:ATP-grasp domain-containing protein n=1 Tax=Thalassiosira oceanica TaxID=159749 RepID=K0S369_THAOC|nr:hypothetical protein THAOC_24813 [Thalassiosira oceanica]|eukprot:EJK55456.1 hypothetical protein THAOC_24813 [Thalassiosira oceanica]
MAPIRRALIVCDVQADVLKSLFAIGSGSTTPETSRAAFLDAVRSCILASVACPLEADKPLIVFSGLQFAPGYKEVHEDHCLFGSLKRLNGKVGDRAVHFFMRGFDGSSIDADLVDVVSKFGGKHAVVMRQTHLPTSELSEHLVDITDVTVVGCKASQSVQATVQYVADHHPGIDCSVVAEALADYSRQRLEAIVEHLLPMYCRVASIEEYVEATCGLEKFAQALALEGRSPANVKFLVDCERGGHFSLYAHHLLHENGSQWLMYPTQKWYEDIFRSKQYLCPLGKRVVGFCGEPQFSEVAMFIKGREFLDDKVKLLKYAEDFMPETIVFNGDCVMSPCRDDSSGPWFVKASDKNGGKAIQIAAGRDESLRLAASQYTSQPGEVYAIQRHISNPHLIDGRKWHLKMYLLLTSNADGGEEGGHEWRLYAHEDAFLCISSKPWSAESVEHEVQVTTRRTDRISPKRSSALGDSSVYDKIMAKCRNIVNVVVRRAIDGGNLQGRGGQKQFEIFSCDFMFSAGDGNIGEAYLIEFNFSPVLYDPHANQQLTTAGLKLYDREYREKGEGAEINDHGMLSEAVSIVFRSSRPRGWRLLDPPRG